MKTQLQIRGTDFVLFRVSDLAVAARFYRETLGLPQLTYNEQYQWAEFDCGDVTLSLHGGPKSPGESTGGRMALAVADVSAAYEHLKQAGAAPLGQPEDYGVCCALEVRDPDGNTIVLHRRADGTFGRAGGTEAEEAARILALERAALDRWGQGDPSGFLEISCPDVVYFDPMLDQRLDGLEALTRLYNQIRGQVHLTRYEMVNPKVQFCGEAAVLTYNFIGQAAETMSRWNCTEVYRRTSQGWRILQTHWSFTRPAGSA